MYTANQNVITFVAFLAATLLNEQRCMNRIKNFS